jgi:hypothetical protein
MQGYRGGRECRRREGRRGSLEGDRGNQILGGWQWQMQEEPDTWKQG